MDRTLVCSMHMVGLAQACLVDILVLCSVLQTSAVVVSTVRNDIKLARLLISRIASMISLPGQCIWFLPVIHNRGSFVSKVVVTVGYL